MSVAEVLNYEADLFARLHGALDVVAELPLAFLPVDRLTDVLLETCRIEARVQGLKAQVIAEAESAALAQRHGERSLTTYIAKQTHGCSKVIGPDRTFAIWMRDFPVLSQALSDGLLTRQHCNELKGIDNIRIHGLMIRDQQNFIKWAQRLQWTDWGLAVGYWLNAADPDGEDTDPASPKYGLTTRTWNNGDVTVSLKLDPITGEAFLTMLDQETKRLHAQEAESPEGATTPVRKLQLDAMMRLLIRGFRRDDGSTPVPLVNIVMSEKVAEDLLARMTGCENPTGDPPMDINLFELPIAWDDIDGRCETIRGTPVHPKHVLWLLFVGNLRRTVMSAESMVLDLGRDSRFFNSIQRNALLVQSRGQCVDGCGSPFRWLQADHVIPWSLHGLTNVSSGAMRCGPDNRRKGTGA
jgi:hypothetical protein